VHKAQLVHKVLKAIPAPKVIPEHKVLLVLKEL